MDFLYILLALFIFGILIFIHELGHFIAARACGVKVLEFAIGMGPKIFRYQGKKTVYSLRLLPIGGYVKLEGEDEESNDVNAFCNKKPWQRFVVLVSGALMNFVLGFLLWNRRLVVTYPFVRGSG